MLIYRREPEPLTTDAIAAVNDVAYFLSAKEVAVVNDRWAVFCVREGVFCVFATVREEANGTH